MSPNPYILLRNLVHPTRWFTSNASRGQRPRGRLEHWDEPVPGTYEHFPGRGWFLIAVDSDDGDKLDKPIPVTYSRILHRYLFTTDFESRRKWGIVRDGDGGKKAGVFFRLDDGVTWVYCWKETGEFDSTPQKQPYCIDAETDKFRAMTASDLRLDGRGTSIGSPSARSFVAGDVHNAQPSKNSLPSTRPSTRLSARSSSGYGTSIQQRRVDTSSSTPLSEVTPQTYAIDGAELKKRLRGLSQS